MLKDNLRRDQGALAINVTAIREDRTAEPVMITDLTFDDCQITSAATFEVGERVNLQLQGQGWIEAQVKWTIGDRAGMTFVTFPAA